MVVKRYVLGRILAVTMLTMVLGAAVVSAAEAETAERVLTIGAAADYAPNSFLDGNGDPAGYNVELTRAIARAMGMNVEIRIGPWGDIRQTLEEGKIDAISGMYYSEERDRLVDFSPPYTIVHHAVFARPDSPRLKTEQGLRGRDIVAGQLNLPFHPSPPAAMAPSAVVSALSKSYGGHGVASRVSTAGYVVFKA